MYDMELEGMAGGISSLFGLGAIKDVAIDSVIVGAAAGGAQIVAELAFSKVDFLKNLPLWQRLALVGVAGVGGAAAIDYFTAGQPTTHWTKKVAGGWAAGLVGWAIKTGVQFAMASPEEAAKMKAGVSGLGYSANDLLLGLGEVASDYLPLPGQMDGLGYSATELQPFPGTSEYLAGLGEQADNAATYIS